MRSIRRVTSSQIGWSWKQQTDEQRLEDLVRHVDEIAEVARSEGWLNRAIWKFNPLNPHANPQWVSVVATTIVDGAGGATHLNNCAC